MTREQLIQKLETTLGNIRANQHYTGADRQERGDLQVCQVARLCILGAKAGVMPQLIDPPADDEPINQWTWRAIVDEVERRDSSVLRVAEVRGGLDSWIDHAVEVVGSIIAMVKAAGVAATEPHSETQREILTAIRTSRRSLSSAESLAKAVGCPCNSTFRQHVANLKHFGVIRKQGGAYVVVADLSGQLSG